MSDANWYTNVFKSWQVKLLGNKPTAEQLASVHGLGARPGKQALAIAMSLRECGVTGSQIVIACGAPQLNKMRGYAADSLLKQLATPPAANNHTVYRFELTAKGKARIERTAKAAALADEAGKAKGEAKAVKGSKGKGAAKRTSKPRKAAAKAVEGGHTEPATVTAEPVIEPGTVTE